MSAMEPFGKILREIRIQNELTQEQVCKKAGLSTSYFSQLELSHRPPPSLFLILKLANAVRANYAQTSGLINAAEIDRGLMNNEISLPKEAQQLIIEIRNCANNVPAKFFRGLISKLREIKN